MSDSERYMDGGKSLLKAEGKKEGNKWVVTFERTLAGGGKGDHSIAADKVYNFGFAHPRGPHQRALPLRLAGLPVRARQAESGREELLSTCKTNNVAA
jgi:hypothetical protein